MTPVLPVVQVALVVGAALLLLALIAPLARLRGPLALGLAILTLGLAMQQGILVAPDVAVLPQLAGLEDAVYALLLWALYGGLAAAAGGLRLSGPPALGAALAGACMGELGAAAALLSSARDRQGAARLALAAAGGAMLGRLGDPAVLVLADRLPSAGLSLQLWILLPLAVAMVLVASPSRRHVRPGAGSSAVTVVTGSVALGVLVWPVARLWLLGAGCLVLAGLALRRHGTALLADSQRAGLVLAPVCWVTGGAVVVLVATAGGLPFLTVLGLDELTQPLGHAFLPLIAGASALLAALVDGPAASLFIAAVVDRGPDLAAGGAVLAAMLGAAAGGLGPLVIVGGLRAGWWRWFLQTALAVMWAWWVTR